MNESKVMRYYNKYLKKISRAVGNTTTTNKDLSKEGKHLFGNKYLGTFSSDTIPNMPPNTYLIVNLDSSNQPGSHWLAIVKGKKEIYVYDSFGRKTITILPSIFEQAGKGAVLDSENDPEQKDSEKNCGARALAWLLVYDQFGKEAAMLV